MSKMFKKRGPPPEYPSFVKVYLGSKVPKIERQRRHEFFVWVFELGIQFSSQEIKELCAWHFFKMKSIVFIKKEQLNAMGMNPENIEALMVVISRMDACPRKNDIV